MLTWQTQCIHLSAVLPCAANCLWLLQHAKHHFTCVLLLLLLPTCCVIPCGVWLLSLRPASAVVAKPALLAMAEAVVTATMPAAAVDAELLSGQLTPLAR
jgi:hypothetical protein